MKDETVRGSLQHKRSTIKPAMIVVMLAVGVNLGMSAVNGGGKAMMKEEEEMKDVQNRLLLQLSQSITSKDEDGYYSIFKDIKFGDIKDYDEFLSQLSKYEFQSSNQEIPDNKAVSTIFSLIERIKQGVYNCPDIFADRYLHFLETLISKSSAAYSCNDRHVIMILHKIEESLSR